MLKTKERPASADQFGASHAHTATAPAGFPRKSSQGSHGHGLGLSPERSHTASGMFSSSSGRASTRMFRKADDTPSPTRKTRRGSPERSPSRPPTGTETAGHGFGNNEILGAPGNGTSIVIAGKGGTEVWLLRG